MVPCVSVPIYNAPYQEITCLITDVASIGPNQSAHLCSPYIVFTVPEKLLQTLILQLRKHRLLISYRTDTLTDLHLLLLQDLEDRFNHDMVHIIHQNLPFNQKLCFVECEIPVKIWYILTKPVFRGT